MRTNCNPIVWYCFTLIGGKNKVGVIVNDLSPSEQEPGKLEAKMKSFQTTQWTTRENAALVLLCGKLQNSPVELNGEQQQQLDDFLYRVCAQKSLGNKIKSVWYKCCRFCCCCCCCCCSSTTSSNSRRQIKLQSSTNSFPV